MPKDSKATNWRVNPAGLGLTQTPKFILTCSSKRRRTEHLVWHRCENENDVTGIGAWPHRLTSDVDCNPKQKEGKPVCHVSVCHTSFHTKQMMKLGLDPGPGVASLLQHQSPLESVQQD